jgi:hypothetical protein
MDDIKPLKQTDKKELSESAPLTESRTDMPNRSRIAKTLENSSKKTLVLSLLGIILIIALLAIFGIPLIQKFAELTSREDKTESTQEEETVILLPPFFDPTFEATNSAEISLSGTAEEGDSIKLYANGKLADEVEIDKDNTFIFKNVELREGKNTFKAKVLHDTDESKFSEPLTITYRKEAPKLSIDYPSEGQGIGNKDGDRLQIEGSTDPDANVTINGFQAVVDDEGKFKYVLSIKGGENSLKAIATDEAGNKTEIERKFTYNP